MLPNRIIQSVNQIFIWKIYISSKPIAVFSIGNLFQSRFSRRFTGRVLKMKLIWGLLLVALGPLCALAANCSSEHVSLTKL